MAIDIADAQEETRHLVHGGFHSPAEILEIVCEEIFSPDDFEPGDADAVTAYVFSAWKEKIVTEQDWPEQTDWDRLDTAFDELFVDSDILALHATGTTQSDGWDDAREIADDLRTQNENPVGACFYHYQDVGNAVDGHGLHLTFGQIGAPATVSAIKIGTTIADALKRHGFDVTWDGTEKQRIHIAIDWKKRYSEDDDDDDEEDEEDEDDGAGEDPASKTWMSRMGQLFKRS